MNRIIIFILTLIFISKLNFAEVNTQLYFVSNIHNNSTGIGTLTLNVEAISDDGEAEINSFVGAIQIDEILVDQFWSITFTNRHFPPPFIGIGGYTRTEEGPYSDGGIKYEYVINGNSRVTIPDSEWITIVTIIIQYSLTPALSTISWYDNINYTVRNQNNVRIEGDEMDIPPELTNISLPVELSSFSAKLKGENVELKWRTETEVDNYGFEIQRASSSTSSVPVETSPVQVWERIGFVEGNGNSNSPRNYFFTDKNPVGSSKFIYRLKQIDNDGTFAYSNVVEVDIIPGSYELFQNYPNPFNPVTNIKFSLPENSNVKLDLYNIIGEHITTLLNKEMEAGFHNIDFNAEALSSGTYIYKLQTDKVTQVKKMLLLK